MKFFGEGLSELHAQLGGCIRKEAQVEEAKALFLQLHAAVHLSAVGGGSANEVDALFCDLERAEYAVMPTAKDETIAWALWHLARIEDLTMGVLAGRGDQLFDHQWQIRLNAPITDTGNALTDDEIMQLSKSLDTAELLHYRNEVGRRTRAMVQTLTAADLRRPVDPALLEKIRSEGGVTGQSDSAWLLDFWAKKRCGRPTPDAAHPPRDAAFERLLQMERANSHPAAILPPLTIQRRPAVRRFACQPL